MRFTQQVTGAAALAIILSTPVYAATITGSVTGPDGKPVMGAFVVAESPQSHRSINVLSDQNGRYSISDLPAGTYNVQINSIGYRAAPQSGISLTADQKASFDFALQKRPVRWSDLSTYQGRKLLPKTEQHDLSHKDPFFGTCFQSCHSFQKRMASAVRDEEGWLDRVKYMSDTIMAGDGRKLSQAEIEEYAKHLTLLFGPDSPKTASPEQMPEYAALVRKFKPEAMNIGYVEYDFPAPNGMGPWSAVEDRDGMIWIPYYGRGNEVVRLNPDTGAMDHFKLPFAKTAGIHSVIPSADGTVWFVETAMGKIAQLDPKTKEITEFQSPPLPDGRRNGAHTIRVDDRGLVWVSGGPAISMFDPKTKEFRHFDLRGTYGNTAGKDGDQWFTSFVADGPIGRISKDAVLTKFQPPTKGKPQRLEVDKDGIVWFTERQGNQLGRLDPATGKFSEYPLPGPEASPYAIGIDRDNMIWYSSHEQDTMNRFDPKTGQVTEYPYPHSEISMREFFLDKKGRLWYASSVNNKVGYIFYNKPANEASK
jgi:virginiamycin B lyase